MVADSVLAEAAQYDQARRTVLLHALGALSTAALDSLLALAAWTLTSDEDAEDEDDDDPPELLATEADLALLLETGAVLAQLGWAFDVAGT